MISITSGLAVGLLLTAVQPTNDLLAVRVGRAETISQGTIEHAVILVEGGKIAEIGEDLPIARGIAVLDRPDWVVTPGLVSCFSRTGLDSRASNMFEPQAQASAELYARQDVYEETLEYGVTTLGLYPPGTGIPGQAVAIKPHGDSPEEMILAEGVFLTVFMQTTAKAKKALRDAFGKVDKYEEKVAKEREKWEKDLEKQNKKKKSKKDDEEEKEEDKSKKVPEVFEPSEPDADVKPFIDIRAKNLRALISIQKASDYLHFLDALGDEDIDFLLHAPLRNDIDLFEIKEKLGERELLIALTSNITLQPHSRRERNIPSELAEAGARVALTPRYNPRRRGADHENWMRHVGELVARGLDRDTALAAMTIEAASVLGLEERLGSLDKGKDANLVFWSGDPFEPGTRVEAVMLEGELVHGEVNQ